MENSGVLAVEECGAVERLDSSKLEEGWAGETKGGNGKHRECGGDRSLKDLGHGEGRVGARQEW